MNSSSAHSPDRTDTLVLWAAINANGHASRSLGLAYALREDGVGYAVKFDRDISHCAWLVTIEGAGDDLGDVPPPYFITVRLMGDREAEARQMLYVVISDFERRFVHVPFHVVVFVPEPKRPPIRIPK